MLARGGVLGAQSLSFADLRHDRCHAAAQPARPLPKSPASRAQDEAGIGRRARYAPVYLVFEEDALQQAILPVHGYGLWSTMYGYLSLESDLNTVAGITFYDHAETPGLGGEIDNPRWQSRWVGKKIYGDDGTVRSGRELGGKRIARAQFLEFKPYAGHCYASAWLRQVS